MADFRMTFDLGIIYRSSNSTCTASVGSVGLLNPPNSPKISKSYQLLPAIVKAHTPTRPLKNANRDSKSTDMAVTEQGSLEVEVSNNDTQTELKRLQFVKEKTEEVVSLASDKLDKSLHPVYDKVAGSYKSVKAHLWPMVQGNLDAVETKVVGPCLSTVTSLPPRVFDAVLTSVDSKVDYSILAANGAVNKAAGFVPESIRDNVTRSADDAMKAYVSHINAVTKCADTMYTKLKDCTDSSMKFALDDVKSKAEVCGRATITSAYAAYVNLAKAWDYLMTFPVAKAAAAAVDPVQAIIKERLDILFQVMQDKLQEQPQYREYLEPYVRPQVQYIQSSYTSAKEAVDKVLAEVKDGEESGVKELTSDSENGGVKDNVSMLSDVSD